MGRDSEILKRVIDLLDKADDLLREAQVEASRLSKGHGWVYREVWSLWQYVGYTARRARELYALLLEEEALKEEETGG